MALARSLAFASTRRRRPQPVAECSLAELSLAETITNIANVDVAATIRHAALDITARPPELLSQCARCRLMVIANAEGVIPMKRDAAGTGGRLDARATNVRRAEV